MRSPVFAIIGLAYAVIGVVFAWPTAHVQMWRLGAWLVSAVLYATHILYERFGVRNPPRPAALRVGLAVALGGFGLAVAANFHSLSAGTSDHQRRLLLIALVAWPVITGLPAFLVAWIISAVLARLPLTRNVSELRP
jgi:hypothetical protein